jgi:hypothetical protein
MNLREDPIYNASFVCIDQLTSNVIHVSADLLFIDIQSVYTIKELFFSEYFGDQLELNRKLLLFCNTQYLPKTTEFFMFQLIVLSNQAIIEFYIDHQTV